MALAIVGAAEAGLGAVEVGTTPLDIMAEATAAALEESGLSLSDVDGLFATTSQLAMPTLSLGEYLGISPRFADSSQVGGSSFMAHLLHAQAAIAVGLCDVAVIAYGSTQRLVGFAKASILEEDPYEAPYGPIPPASGYALATARHMHEFGTTREQLAEVAVAARKWANLHPQAFKQGPLTIEDVLTSPMVADPLTVRDCCLVTDGGGALVVTSLERARTLRKAPVVLLGAGEGYAHRNISSMEDLVTTPAVQSGRRAFEQARLAPTDVDVLGLYDAFTINPILFLEDLGFCAKGEGGPFVADGCLAPGGNLAVNTNGGGLSYNHPGMYGLQMIVEAVRQLRGEAGARQVANAQVALVHGNGGVLSSQCTAILGTLDAATETFNG